MQPTFHSSLVIDTSKYQKKSKGNFTGNEVEFSETHK